MAQSNLKLDFWLLMAPSVISVSKDLAENVFNVRRDILLLFPTNSIDREIIFLGLGHPQLLQNNKIW